MGDHRANRRRFLQLLAGAAPLLSLSPLARGVPSTGRRDGPCRPGSRSPVRSAPAVEAIVLGTAQDAGVPQVNCFRHFCAVVRAGEAIRPRVASLGLIDRQGERRYLIDATPDFVAQVGELLGPGLPEATVPLHDHLHGIFLTHAHMGHYTGLVQLGKEGAAPRGLPLYASARMLEYLGANEPWATLLREGYAEGRTLTAGEPVDLGTLRVVPVPVVHRAELSDTFAYLAEGTEQTLFYVPDADTWDGWPLWSFEECLERADLALLDGSFFSHDELGHRPQGEVPHPPVRDTLERLEALRAGNNPGSVPDVLFTHLNHTNPLWLPASPECVTVRRAGYDVAAEGERIPL